MWYNDNIDNKAYVGERDMQKDIGCLHSKWTWYIWYLNKIIFLDIAVGIWFMIICYLA